MYVVIPQCTDVESPDVILIKDEDDIGGCEPGEGEVINHFFAEGSISADLGRDRGKH